jgi:hypothetical protein
MTPVTAVEPTIFTAALDWLTIATYRFEAYTKMVGLLRARDTSTKWKAGRWLQYDGFHDGSNIFYGHTLQTNEREHYIVKISGHAAHTVFRDLMDNPENLDILQAFYATRIDVQVTRDIPDWWNPRDCYDDMVNVQKKTASVIQSDTGATLYIGKRTSGRFIRFYVKDLEKPYLRLEFELKAQYARDAWTYLVEENMTPAELFEDMLMLSKLPGYMRDSYDQAQIRKFDYTKHATRMESNAKLKWLVSLLPTFEKMTRDHQIGEMVQAIFDSLSREPQRLDMEHGSDYA